MSLRPVAVKLADLLGCHVAFVDDCIGEKVEKTVGDHETGDVLLLENVRYYNEEEANDPAFAEKLAKVADVYVNDAFGAAHRAHASTEGVARVVAKRGGQCAAGLLMERELKFLGDELDKPARPFVVILGGAKVSDKIEVIDRLLEKANTILIGGAMAAIRLLFSQANSLVSVHGSRKPTKNVERDLPMKLPSTRSNSASEIAIQRGVSTCSPAAFITVRRCETASMPRPPYQAAK